MARLAAYHESPEGRARSRIFKLELQTFAEGLSTAEQNELDSLRTLYPDLPLDPNGRYRNSSPDRIESRRTERRIFGRRF
jgi:hypothetical protein